MRNTLLCATFVLLLVPGCAGVPPMVEHVVSTSEGVIDTVDTIYDPILADAIADAEGLSDDLKDEALRPYLNAAEILLRADQAARTARVALNTWNDLNEGEGFQIVGCLAIRLTELLSVMKDMDLPIPDELVTVSNYANAIFRKVTEGSSCGH